jgi:predicted acetyltransferase
MDRSENFMLVEPTEEYAEDIRAFRQEFLDWNSSMDGVGSLKRTEDPYEWINYSRRQTNPAFVSEGHVTATQYLYVRKSDNRIVGVIQVRHYFNEFLASYGGNIGYSIRPSERRKGYAKMMLRAVLPHCKALGRDKILVTCVDGNVGSENTIRANGGVFQNTVYEPKRGIWVKRFWIDL